VVSRLTDDGYTLLRGAIPELWLGELRTLFDAGVLAPSLWPVPRGADWRHSQLDLAPRVQEVCRLPALLACVGARIRERFFLAQVEGREPMPGGGQQPLHRDFSAERPGDTVIVIAFLDDYGPENGATRIVPASHRTCESTFGEPDSTRLLPFPLAGIAFLNEKCRTCESVFPASPQESDFSRPARESQAENNWDERSALQLSGSAGDILVFDADLVHAGSLNASGKRRRSLLMSYFAEPQYAAVLETQALRNVRMEVAWFEWAFES
jgi:ectoine hydroxylase-related dioxygenase (phytanoyl-CoA dioxygenase family)